jgi:hypothetical protein
MSVVGFITRSGGSNFFSQATGNTGSTGGNAYIARQPDGTSLGGYNSAGEALTAFRRLFGANRVFQIRRRDLPSRVEHYEVISDPPSPNEIFEDSLISWFEPGFGPSVVLSGPPAASSEVLSIRSRTSKPTPAAFQPVLMNQGFLSVEDSQFKDATVLDTDDASDRFYDVTNVVLQPPFAIFVCANHATGGISPLAAAVSYSGGGAFIGDPSGTGNWGLNNGSIINGSQPISTGRPDVVVYEQSTTGAKLSVNGVLEGANAAVPGAGTVQIATNPDPWRGKFASVFIVQGEPGPSEVALATRYLTEAFR